MQTKEAFKLGCAIKMAELGIGPEEFGAMLKVAQDWSKLVKTPLALATLGGLGVGFGGGMLTHKLTEKKPIDVSMAKKRETIRLYDELRKHIQRQQAIGRLRRMLA